MCWISRNPWLSTRKPWLEETRRIETPDFTIVYLGDHQT